MATANASDDEDDYERISLKSYSTVGSSLLDQIRPGEEKTECLSVHVSNLPAGIKEYEIFEKFHQFGPIAEPGVVIRQYAENPVASYAFVNFSSPSIVEEILKSDTPIIIRGAKVTVKAGTSSKRVDPQKQPDVSPKNLSASISLPKMENIEKESPCISPERRSIWIGNVPIGTTPEELSAKFTAFGKLDRPLAKVYQSPNRDCCYGFVNFVSPVSVTKVFTVNPKIYINNNLLEIKYSNSKQDTENFPESVNFGGKSARVLNVDIQKETKPKAFVSSKNPPVEGGKTIWVGNLPPNATSRELYVIFASYGKLGKPGIMVYQSSKSNTCYAFVNYISPDSAQKALKSDGPIFKGHRLRIRIQSRVESSASDESSSVSSKASKPVVNQKTVQEKAQYFTVRVKNLPKDIPRQEVFNIFRPYGTIAEPPSLQINEREHVVTVPYVRLSDAEKLVKRSNGLLEIRSGTVTLVVERAYGFGQKPTDFKENFKPQNISTDIFTTPKTQPVPRQTVTKPNPPNADEINTPNANKIEEIRQWTETSSAPQIKDENSNGVQIRNINKLSSNELLHQYIKNEKRSGGGAVQKLIVEKDYDRAVVIFERANDAENFLKKGSHLLESVTLYVSQLPPFYNSRFYIENIPQWVTNDRLKDYLEARAHCDVKEIMFREDDKGAIIIFNEEKICSYLEKELKAKPLKDGDKQMNDVKIFSVVYPDAVLVYGNIPSVDSLTLAFEDFLTTNAADVARPDVRNVFTKDKLNMTLVIFEDHQAVSCLNDSITIAEKTFPVVPFYDYLGWVPLKNKANFIREHISAIVKTKLTPLQTEFLLKPISYEFVKEKLEKQNWLCHFEIDQNRHELSLTASKKDLSEFYSKFVLDLMKSFEIRLDGPMLKSWNDKGSQLRQLVSDKDVKNYFCFFDDKTTLTVLALSTELERIQQMVENFFSDHSVYEECIVDSQIYGKYLKEYHETDLKVKCSSGIMDIKFAASGLITASGTKNRIELLKSDVRVILSDCEIAKYSVLRPGMSNHFRNYQGWTEISAIAKQTQTIILKDTEFDETPIILASATHVHLEGVYNQNIKILVICGDLTRQNVDAIVNAANENLEHTGGLARAIVDAGGQQIQTECRNHIKRNGCLNTSDVFVSQPGKLSCKKVIHVAGPRWNYGTSGEGKKLHKAIMNCINTANAERLSSIAIPAVSTKIFGFPVDQAIPIIVEAVVEACKIRQTVEEIRLVDNDLNTVNLFAQSVSKLKDFQQKPLKSQIVQLPSSSNASVKIPPIIPVNIRPLNPPPVTTASINSLILNGCTIKIIKDDIVNVAKQCNAIVNTTSANNLLGGSNSSNAIKNAAGIPYVQDIQQNFPNGILQGTRLAKTVAGNLGCQYVYHVAFHHAWNPASGPTSIMNRVNACLDQLMKDGRANIAFPAVGTGGLKYPADVVAKTMFDAAINWLNSKPNSNLKNIIFVVFPTDATTVLQFENEYKARCGGGPAVPAPVPVPTIASAVKIGSIDVEVIKGDIIKEKTDSIICPSNDQLDLTKGQVANALKTAGGKEFEKIILNYNKSSFKKGVLPVFTVNVLPYKCVIFIDAPIENHYNWHEVFMQSLKEANKHNLTSIAVPALGTGQLNRNVAEVADMMLQTIQTFATTKRNNNLKLIRIIIYQSVTYDQFCQHISTMVARGKTTPSSTLFSKTLNWVLKKMDIERGTRTVPVEKREVEKNLLLYICGSKDSVQKAQSDLDKTCDDNCPERIITKDIIGTLDNDAVSTFNERAQQYDVKIYVSRQQNKITIKGFRAVEFQHYLTDVLDKVKEEMSDLTVKWYKRKNTLSSWELINFGASRLEKAYQKLNRKGRLLNFDLDDSDDDDVTVDFDKMNVLSKRKDVLFQLKRVDSEHIPVEWDWDGTCQEEYKMIQLDSQSSEFATVRNAVLLTATVNIIKIERIENPVKYQQYMVLKRKMEQSMPNRNVEHNLFHGTAADNIKGICTLGFNRSLCGQNGTMYGHGSYFARDFKYSTGYGHGTIFYAKVLTGNFTVGNPQMKVAPDFDTSKGTKYDSVVNDLGNPAIYVVFSDNHAYPAYLITYN